MVRLRAANAAAVAFVAFVALAQAAAVPAQRLPAQQRDAGPQRSGDTAGMHRVPWYAPIASLAVPGLGQALLRENRALAYIAVESYSVLEYRAQLTEAKRDRNRYREMANDVARRFFEGARPIGPFEYYESLEKYVESGTWDRIPGGDIDPELDEATFNGSIWLLARETYWTDPNLTPPVESAAYANAVNLYLRRAVQPEYRWSWRDAALEHDLYRRSIKRSNDAYRRGREQLGILLANHLLSMADAFATVRLRYLPPQNGVSHVNVELRLPWPSRR